MYDNIRTGKIRYSIWSLEMHTYWKIKIKIEIPLTDILA